MRIGAGFKQAAILGRGSDESRQRRTRVGSVWPRGAIQGETKDLYKKSKLVVRNPGSPLERS